MFSPNPVAPSSLASRNPRRRQRNGSEDSTAFPPHPKRLRRSGLTPKTFEAPPTQHANGHPKPLHYKQVVNGDTDAGTQRDTASLAVRPRGGKTLEKENRTSVDNGGKQLTKNDNYIVTQLPTTPESLQDGQSSADWRGEIYSRQGYGLATTHEHVIVWRYGQDRDSGTTQKPLKIKLLHPSINSRQSLPLALLIPSAGEPGLLVVMPTSGKVTYWESLSVAASPASDRQKHLCLQGTVTGIMSGEIITKVTEAEPHGFVLTLSSGRVVHLTISDPQGKPSIATRFLRSDAVQASGLFGGLKSVFSTAGWKRDIAVVRPGPSLHRGQRQLVIATTKGAFQIWDLDWKGTHSMVYEINGKDHFLKALAEGGDIFHDRYDHHFEVLDFTFKPQEVGTEAKPRTGGKGDCNLYVLTVLHGNDQSKYNVLGLTIANGTLTVDVVHPISCYRCPVPPDSSFKPQVVVPEPGRTAFLVFEKSIVLISLSEIKLTADDQMCMDAGMYEGPFQDAIDFNRRKDYRSVACTAESAESQQSPASCVILVHGFGMIRVLAMPMPEVESARDRIAVTARTKIEQAIFYGNMPQNLLDFSGRPEISFSQDQIESAAKEISLSILKNESPYIPKIMPSLDNQLQRRASALADLIKHLKLRYKPLSRPTRWQLLWDAEKLAAATAIWHAHQLSKEKYPGEKRYILSEAIEACDVDLKTENQPDHHETDGVRHWFANDIWRIEKLLPYVEFAVEYLYDQFDEADLAESTGSAATPVLRARWLGEAIDLELAALETAFRFREANAVLYGMTNEPMTDGVLQSGFEGLPEPWTAGKELVGRVEKQIYDSLKTYEEEKNNETQLREAHQEMEEELVSLLQDLQDNLPRQIEIWNQTRLEQFRWLKSQSDQDCVEEGNKLQRDYFTRRKELFVALCAIADYGPAATHLAEKYADMAALVEIKDLERLEGLRQLNDPETALANKKLLKEGLEALEEQILSYFTKYGNNWSDAYFIKHLNNQEVHKVFEQSATYQQSLTAFLRRHPEYSKIQWINEICAERNFLAAADSLQHSLEHENILWYKKIELSMRKLALLAASQQTQVKDDVAKDRIKDVDDSTAIVNVQEALYEYIRPTLEGAIDADAEVELVRGTHFKEVQPKSYLPDLVRRSVKRLVYREVLDPEDLVDMLTLINEGAYEDDADFFYRRFFLALQFLKLAGYQHNEPARHELLEHLIWRRCIIQDDWAAINQTEDKDDEQVEDEIASTAYFVTLREAFANDPPLPSLPPPPSSFLSSGTTLPSLRRSPRYANHPEAELARLAKDMQLESQQLEEAIEKGRLEERWQGILEDARESLKREQEERMERMERRREEDGDGDGELEVDGS